MPTLSETERTVQSLVERHGTLFSEELGINLGKNTPSQLFRWLCAALLMSARISHQAAIKAARALSEAGWTTASKMAESSWEGRVRVLNRSGYARYDESTARMLGDTAERLQAEYCGDLRRLRAASDQKPGAERERLKTFKGIGDVGADIFFREVQTVWPEHFPFLDAKARKAARRLGLPDTPGGLADLVGRERFAHVAAALVRAELDNVAAEDLAGAAGS
jgi:endonuclease III